MQIKSTLNWVSGTQNPTLQSISSAFVDASNLDLDHLLNHMLYLLCQTRNTYVNEPAAAAHSSSETLQADGVDFEIRNTANNVSYVSISN